MTDAWGAAKAGDSQPRYLLIESQGPGAPHDAGFRRDAVVQAETGRPVLLFLVQDGVTFALPGTDAETDRYLNAGGRLAADRFSLIQRGIAEEALRPQARATDMDEVAGWVLDPDIRVVWH